MIHDRETAEEYSSILSDGHASVRLTNIAEATDKAMEAVLEVFKECGVKFPNDDRCYNVEVMIYKTAKESN